jgi:hypothetical protein
MKIIIRKVKSGRMKLAGYVAHMEEKGMHIGLRRGYLEGKKQLGRPRRRWKDNIKINLRKIGWSGMDWIHLVQDRVQRRALVNTVMNLRVP